MKRLLLALAFVGPAHAEFMDGNRLLEKIVSSSYYEQGSGMGYIMGVADMGLGVIHCAPANATAGQMQDMVRQHLQFYPERRTRTADSIVNDILKTAWPCPARTPGRPL